MRRRRRGSQLQNTVPKNLPLISYFSHPPPPLLPPSSSSSSRCRLLLLLLEMLWDTSGEVDLGLSLLEGGVVGYGISISMVSRVSHEIYSWRARYTHGEPFTGTVIELSLFLSLSLSRTHTYTDAGCFPGNVGREGGSCHRLQLGRLLFLRFTVLLGPG